LHDYIVTEKSIKNRITGTEFIFKGLFRNEMTIKSYEDIDICWVEEAQALSMESIEYLIPTVRKAGSELWYSMNRFADNDPIWQKIKSIPDDEKIVKKINITDLPAKLQSDELIREMQADKIADFDRYLHTWEGEPLGQEANACIPKRQIIEAMQRKIEPLGGLVTGADIARFGDDRTQFYMRKGLKVIKSATYRKKSVVQVANLLMDFVEGDKEQPINIDDTGLGGGVTDILKDRGFNAVPINFGWGKDYLKEPDKYYNLFTEMMFNFREIIDTVQLPNDEELKEEMGNRLYVYKPDERKMVERKEDYKKRHGKSPDKLDTCLLCFYQPKSTRGFMGFSTKEVY
jgi:phage terminase large subunit